MVEVRTLEDGDIGAFVAAVLEGFHKIPQPGDEEFQRPRIEIGRSYGAFDGSTMVGTARSFRTTLTVPGPLGLPVAGVTSVTVRASHRRRGVLTEMMRRQLEEIAGRGEAVAILIASEAPIYTRFGYGPASENVRLEVDAHHLRFTGPPPGGTVRFVDAAGFRRAAPPVYERFRVGQPGAIDRAGAWWDMVTGITPRPGADPPGFMAVHTDAAGEATGFVRYSVSEAWTGRAAASTLVVNDLVAASDEAYEALWRFITSVDWIVRVTADDRPSLEPLRGLVQDRRDVREVDRSDFLWVRLLDIPAALAARRYRVADHLVIEVIDEFRPASGGRFALDAGPDRAVCGPTSAPADLTITTSDLAAAFLGSTPLWPAAAAGRVAAHGAGAVDRFDRLFGMDRPAWCHTWF